MSTETRARLDAAVEEIVRGTYSLPRIHLLLERAAASGATRSALDRVIAGDAAQRRRARRELEPSGGARRIRGRRPRGRRGSSAVTVGAFLLAMLSVIPVLPARRLTSDWIMELGDGAPLAAALSLPAAGVLLWAEARRADTLGSRTGLFPRGTLLIPLLWLVAGVGVIIGRSAAAASRTPGSEPTTIVIGGGAVVALSAVLVLLALVVATRRRPSAPDQDQAPGSDARAELARAELARREADIDRALVARTREALAGSSDRHSIGAALAAAVRELHRVGELDDEGAAELRALIGV